MLQHDCGRQVSRVWHHQDGCCCSASLHLQIITVISMMIGPSWVLLCSDSAHCDRGKPEPAEPYQVEPTSMAVADRRSCFIAVQDTLLLLLQHIIDINKTCFSFLAPFAWCSIIIFSAAAAAAFVSIPIKRFSW